MYCLQIPAEARDDSQVTADGTQADTTSNHTTPSPHDDAVGEDDSQRVDNIAVAAGSSDTILKYAPNLIHQKQTETELTDPMPSRGQITLVQT